MAGPSSDFLFSLESNVFSYIIFLTIVHEFKGGDDYVVYCHSDDQLSAHKETILQAEPKHVKPF